ncbi:MAG: alpha/beta hydrolase [Myxococcales bacterium]|nr:alpha/beta hydrolase [Myxococcales bacterium]
MAIHSDAAWSDRAPEPRSRFTLTLSDGAEIEVRRHGNPDGRRVLVSHGNGFATDGYWHFWRLLATDCDLIIYDQRNHGQNPLHCREHHHVARFADDLEALRSGLNAHFGEKPLYGVFHSLSAIVSVAHAQRYPWPWRALVLVDPPFCPPPGDPLRERALLEEGELAERAARRKDAFASPADLAKRFREGMGDWVPGAPEAMAHAVLRKGGDPEKPHALACPGAFESRVFAENSTLNLTPTLEALPEGVLFLGADPTLEPVAVPALVNRSLHDRYGLRYEAIARGSHMLQLEQPEAVAARVLAFFESVEISAEHASEVSSA